MIYKIHLKKFQKRILVYVSINKRYLLDLVVTIVFNQCTEHDAEKTRADLEAMKSLKLATELSKKEIEDQLQDLVNNESRLRSINTKTFDQLSEKRGKLIAYFDFFSDLI